MAATRVPPQTVQRRPAAIDPVRITPASLIALAHAGETLPLQPARIRALQSGGYLSPFRGRGMEFDETRPYQPGDDVRHMDWKVTARTGKPHTKQFREERERPVLVWVDLRRPMFFATRGAFKSVVAARAAALLGWSTAAHRDRLGGLIFSETVHTEIKPGRGKPAVLHFIQALCRHPAWNGEAGDAAAGDGSLGEAMVRLRNVAYPGSLIFLLSDFRGFDERAERHLGRIARHNDVVMIPVNDPLEHELPPPGRYRLTDGRRHAELDTRDPDAWTRYRERVHRHEERLRQFCRRHRIYQLALQTADPVVDTLQTGLGLSPAAGRFRR